MTEEVRLKTPLEKLEARKVKLVAYLARLDARINTLKAQ